MIQFLAPYHYPVDRESVTVDGTVYKRVERLPRNVRAGDVVRVFDGNDPKGPREAFLRVRDVVSYPKTQRGYRVYAAEVQIHVIDSPWWWGAHRLRFYGDECRERFTFYRA